MGTHVAKTLAVLPSFTAIRRTNGRLVLSHRFISGMARYRQHFDGRLLAILEPEEESAIADDLDRTLSGENVEVGADELEFDLELIDYDDHRRLGDAMSAANVALASIHYRQNHFADIGNDIGVPVVYITEYTLLTRLQIVMATETTPFARLKRSAWEVDQERQIRRCIKRAAGVQCNGTPTYDAYHSLAQSSILYFDGRGSDELLLPWDKLDKRLANVKDGDPIRLVFAGRLNEMKGADELLEVASHLVALGVPFELDIFGGGVLEQPMRDRVAKEGLDRFVTMHGFVPFPELIERTADSWDLFLCCHVQGDPSGMYLEMLGRGLPMVGYANEALAGILRRTNVGRVVPIRDAIGAAKEIQRLQKDRRTIAFWSRAARTFGESHTATRTFERRTEHLLSLMRP